MKQGTTDLQSNQKKKNKIAIVSPYLTIITLDVSVLKFSIKRQRMDKWIKNKIQQYAVYQRLTLILKTHIESEGMEKMFQANGNQKLVGVIMLISD